MDNRVKNGPFQVMAKESKTEAPGSQPRSVNLRSEENTMDFDEWSLSQPGQWNANTMTLLASLAQTAAFNPACSTQRVKLGARFPFPWEARGHQISLVACHPSRLGNTGSESYRMYALSNAWLP